MKTLHDEKSWLSWMDELSAKNYVVIDHFLTDELYILIRQFYLSNLHKFSIASIGSHKKNIVKQEIRGDHIFWLDSKRDAEISSFWDLVREMINVFNRYCFLNLSDFEFHFAKYPPESKYVRHLDQFENDNNRAISIVIYLNKDWKKGDGGELEVFLDENDSIIIEPLAMRCVMFRSAVVPHAVLKSHKERYSLTGWLLHKPSTLKQLL